MGTLQHIFIAPARGQPMVELGEAQVLTDCGIVGDRYADASLRKSVDYQITLIELENIVAFTQASGRPLAPQDPRRNLVTVGADLNSLCGMHFAVGSVELEGIELCEPCATLGERTYPEAIRFFVHRGGLRCRILRGGTLRVGDAIRVIHTR